MLKALLLARRRHCLNFIRYHFDGPTLLILGGTGLLIAYQLWRSPADIGVSLEALGRPGFGRRWAVGLILSLPLVYAALFLLARRSQRRTPELDLVRCLPVPGGTVRAWLLARHLAQTGPLLLVLALPALGDSRLTAGGVLRAGALLAALSGLDFLALRHARAGAAGGPRGGRRPWPLLRFPARGGAVPSLMIRDVTYLLRKRRSAPLVAAAAAAGEALAVATIDDPTGGLMAVAVLQAAYGLVQLGLLEALFGREVGVPGLLRSLPVGGARVWRARMLLTIALLALPGLPALAIAIFRGVPPVAWGTTFLATFLAGPIIGGLLFADVHVALFPRTRIATFLLTGAVVLMTLFWFFVPFASPLVAVALLLLWGRRAAAAFDRAEVA